ncbi:hypothetical protein LDL36_20940 [Komagataeibacter sp. FNDCR1]|nr:hypothetical protein [Komagataeibacter sp. FNDCR1]
MADRVTAALTGYSAEASLPASHSLWGGRLARLYDAAQLRHHLGQNGRLRLGLDDAQSHCWHCWCSPSLLSLKDFSKENGGNQPLNAVLFQRILKEFLGKKYKVYIYQLLTVLMDCVLCIAQIKAPNPSFKQIKDASNPLKSSKHSPIAARSAHVTKNSLKSNQNLTK